MIEVSYPCIFCLNLLSDVRSPTDLGFSTEPAYEDPRPSFIIVDTALSLPVTKCVDSLLYLEMFNG